MFFDVIVIFLGMKLALKMFPDGLFTGTPPFDLTGVKPKSTKPAVQRVFSNEDINKIEMFLDNALQDKSVGSELYIKFLLWMNCIVFARFVVLLS